MERLYRTILRHKLWVLVFYALLMVPVVYFALGVKVDNSLDGMMVPTLPDYKAFQEFKKKFGSDEFILLALEGKDIFSEAYLDEMDRLESNLGKVPHLLKARSLISTYRQIRPLFNPHDEQDRKDFKDFALSSTFFQQQGLIAPGKLMSIVMQLAIQNSDQRRDVVAETNKVLKPFEDNKNSSFQRIRKVGQPYLNYELDVNSTSISSRFFPIYLLFASLLIFFLYRSFKAIVGFLVVLGVSIAVAVAAVGVVGENLTMVSAVLPMMVMVVTLSTLVHLYSGYVNMPRGEDKTSHLIAVIRHKFLACLLNNVTTAIGFGSFVTSNVKSVRDLGLFVAIALATSLVITFTLFPTLVTLLNPPTSAEKKPSGMRLFDPLLRALPAYTYWYRHVLVLGFAILGGIGIGAFLHTEMETNSLNYLSEKNAMRQDTIWIEENLMGLLSQELSLDGPKGFWSSPQRMREVLEYERSLLAYPDIRGIISASTLLKTAHHLDRGIDAFPDSNFRVSTYTLALTQQNIWSNYVSEDFSSLRISANANNVPYSVFHQIQRYSKNAFDWFKGRHPEFSDVQLTLSGQAPLMADLTIYLTETLSGSFTFTLGIVFILFLMMIRNPLRTVVAMMPSLLAILLMFLAMELISMRLDVATILIAAIALGIGVDNTIHFFYHFNEKEKAGGNTEQCLDNVMRTSGRAMILAACIVVSGFGTFAFSDFPPLHNFGVLSAIAMVLALLGNLLFLPAVLWMFKPKDAPSTLAHPDVPWWKRMLPPKLTFDGKPGLSFED